MTFRFYGNSASALERIVIPQFVVVAVMLVLHLCNGKAWGDESVSAAGTLAETVVSAPRSIGYLDVPGSDVTVFTAGDIDSLAVQNIPDLLEQVASIDITGKGTPGSQADISMRGSSYEGVLVMVNGITVRDPQTGHFSLDLPVRLESVERIEVLRGGGSAMYGSSAAGGIVNIVTRTDTDTAVNVKGGSFGSVDIQMKSSREFSNGSATFSAYRDRSDGYRDGTDMLRYGGDVTARYGGGPLSVTWYLGSMRNKFGARDFYGPYPSYEKTTTLLGTLHGQYRLDNGAYVGIRAGARGHGDDFLLDRSEPDGYRNTHYNRSYVAAAEYVTPVSAHWMITMGAESQRIGITSGSFGVHAVTNNAMYSSVRMAFRRLDCSLTARYDTGFRDERIFTPSAGISVGLSDDTRLRVRAEKSFRSPTYTELYYDSPANRGNPDCDAETSYHIEAGVEKTAGRSRLDITIFSRQARDVIDWVSEGTDTVWYVVNHGEIDTRGVELNVTIPFASRFTVRTGTTILSQDVERREGVRSKYALNPSLRTIVGSLNAVLWRGALGAVTVRYEDHAESGSYAPVGLRFTQNLGSVRTSLEARNLLDHVYEDLPGLPAPGRWITAGMEYRL